MKRKQRRPKLALVCSHGGHLTELIALSSAWKDTPHFWVTYDSPRTRDLRPAYRMRNIGFNPLLLAIALVRFWFIFAKERPSVVLTNGAEIALPAVLVGRLLGSRVLFIEVWTRVQLPSLTGRILYPFSDAFFVMWPELRTKYGARARYEGGFL